jgi:spore germination protein YaaH
MLMLLLHAPSSGRREGDPGAWRRRRLLAVAGMVLVVVAAAVVTAARSPVDPHVPVAAGPDEQRDPGVPAAPDPDPRRDPAPPGRTASTVVGYLPYWEQRAAVTDALRDPGLLTTAAPWWYAPTRAGGVVLQHRGHTDTGAEVVRELRDGGLTVMPTIANHRNGEWNFEVVPELIADPAARRAHVRNLADLARRRDFDGIVIDYELLGAGDRDNFTAFLTELGAALHADGRRLAVALHAQASDEGSGEHNQAQDYRAIGRVVDEVHLMTYDHHWDESDPGAIAPLPWVVNVLDYATARIPADKLVLGIGLFGYDWGGGEVADDLQLAQVARRIEANDGEQGWDPRAMSPWFRYRRDGRSRVIWYEDVASVEAKLALVARYDLAGAFFWRLGGVPDDIWRTARQTLRPDA